MTEASAKVRGRLTVVLGYAAGVGKTCRMLDEGRQLLAAGRDVVIGLLETHGRRETQAKAEGLEFVPPKEIAYKGGVFREPDVEAVIRRRPAVCLLDELAHTNAPGSPRAKRWEDIQAVLDAGIDVYTTLNVQHLESLNDQVRQISGVKVHETVPDWVLGRAEAIILVDLAPEALINRLKRGDVYEPQAARLALENFFRESTLDALREIALRQAALEVDAHQQAPEPPAESVLIHLTADPLSTLLLRRGRRIADHLGLGCVAAAFAPNADLAALPPDEAEAVRQYLNLARRLQIETRVLDGGRDAAAALLDLAVQRHASHILLVRPKDARRFLWFGDHEIARIARLARGVRITFVAPRRRCASSQDR